MTGNAGPGIGSVDSPAPVSDAEAPTPLLLVVARGHACLLAELEAMFRDDRRVRVIEDRRRGQALLPRSETFTRAEHPSG